MKERVRSDLAFLDMLFNMALAFALLFLLAFIMIKPSIEPSKKAIEMKAEFVLTLSWPDGSLDDQDLWVKMPDGKMIGYSNRDIGVMTLDRDDRGGLGNTYVDPIDGTLKIQAIRREIVTIRTVLPGRYVVNVHTFADRKEYAGISSPAVMPYSVEVTLVKLNPSFQEVTKQKVLMEKLNDQKTVLAFTVGENGEITSVETDVDEPFVPSYR